MTCIDRVGRQNPSAEAETREGDGKGSLLYRLHMWYMRWGNTHEGMQMVRRFAEKEMEEFRLLNKTGNRMLVTVDDNAHHCEGC